MRKRNLALAALTLIVGIALGWVGNTMAAGEPLPGSEQDPLVSRSYVQTRVAAAVAEAESRTRMSVVEVPAGERLIGSAGTEIVVRSGTATVVDTQSGGLSDVTEGKDLRMGETAPRNHLLLVPRDDGRGIQASTSVIVMVRGAYTVR